MTKPAVTRITRTEETKRGAKDVFAFFDRPENLKRVTPRKLAISMEKHPSDLRPGTIFSYRLRRWPLDLSWEAVVSEYRPPDGFTNVKCKGYFFKWDQRFKFIPKGDRTQLELTLEYEVPPGLYATISNNYVIRRAMEELVDEQMRAVREALDRGE